MRKFIIIALLTLHTVASSGTVLSMHYCMGSLASLSVGEKHGTGCDICGMEDRGCCHDDVKVIKIDGTQELSNATSHLFPKEFFILPKQPFRLENEYFAIQKQATSQFPIQVVGSPPIFILNCNFRI